MFQFEWDRAPAGEEILSGMSSFLSRVWENSRISENPVP
jgi:hypothetical protein